MKKISDTVFTSFKKLGEEIPEWNILEEGLTLLESAEREKYWMEYYKKQGYKLFNKVKGGGLGNLTAITLEESRKHCEDVAKTCQTAGDFYNNHHKEWKKAQRNGWLKDYTWLKSKEELNEPTKEEVEKTAKTCKNVHEFSQKHKHEYYYAVKWKITDELFPNKLHNKSLNIWNIDAARKELEKHVGKNRRDVVRFSVGKWSLRNDFEYFNKKFPPENTTESIIEYAKTCISYEEFTKDKIKLAFATKHGTLKEIKNLYGN